MTITIPSFILWGLLGLCGIGVLGLAAIGAWIVFVFCKDGGFTLGL